ncbi:hypothetical protein OSB04_011464 [Centaurea solstitialis]|uniref:CCHC-type domain-containing protein n=1 Tax=Centaurea solstitialis TaxID=347529 RepID=A0AA38WLI8_9ASTR|nr:hypothetical protein OSB04_011464 [Centaurea solstitialis]
MAEEDEFPFDHVESRVCATYTDSGGDGKQDAGGDMSSRMMTIYVAVTYGTVCATLFDIYQNVESSKVLSDSLESKYMADDASSKKFLVSIFNNYKMVDSRPMMEQYNELLRILCSTCLNEVKKGPNKKVKLTCWTCGMTGHFKRNCRVGKNKNGASSSDGGKGDLRIKTHGNFSLLTLVFNSKLNYVSLISEAFYVREDDAAWWIDSGVTSHVCKD